jgi:hypothetical protein
MSLSHHLAMECRIEQGRIQAIAAISQVLTYFIPFVKRLYQLLRTAG